MSEFEKWVFNRFGMGSNHVKYKELKEAWQEARKGYVKVEDVLEKIEQIKCLKTEYPVKNEMIYYVYADRLAEEIKKLGGE